MKWIDASPTGNLRQPILVVDDDPGRRDAIAHTFAASGLRVISAASTAQAQALVGLHPVIGTVVTAFSLNGINGLEFALWTRYTLPSARVVILCDSPEQRDQIDPTFADAAGIRVLDRSENLAAQLAEALNTTPVPAHSAELRTPSSGLDGAFLETFALP